MTTDLQQIAADYAIGNDAHFTEGQAEGFSGWIGDALAPRGFYRVAETR